MNEDDLLTWVSDAKESSSMPQSDLKDREYAEARWRFRFAIAAAIMHARRSKFLPQLVMYFTPPNMYPVAGADGTSTIKYDERINHLSR